MLKISRPAVLIILLILLGAWIIQLALYLAGLFDNQDYFTIFEVNFFAVYGYYIGVLIQQFLNKPRG